MKRFSSLAFWTQVSYKRNFFYVLYTGYWKQVLIVQDFLTLIGYKFHISAKCEVFLRIGFKNGL